LSAITRKVYHDSANWSTIFFKIIPTLFSATSSNFYPKPTPFAVSKTVQVLDLIQTCGIEDSIMQKRKLGNLEVSAIGLGA
jgi:hypothetical protein